MSYLPPADRAFDVRQPIPIYRLVGRRPSAVFLDASMTPTGAGHGKDRLSDSVYWLTKAKIGDQIQERPGTTLLITAEGQAFQILLAEPQALEPTTAFVHAQATSKADRAVAARLVVEGALEDALPRRARTDFGRAPLHNYGEGNPLVVDEAPPEIDAAADSARQRAGSRFGRRRFNNSR